MAYPMGSSAPLAIGDRVEEPDPEATAAPVRLPLSTGDGPTGDAASLVRSMLDDQMLDEFVARMRTDGVRLSGPGGFLTEMLKAVLERGLQAELTDHLGYDKHEAVGRGTGNSRNGTTAKTLLTEVGPVPLEVPRDRAGTFTPVLVPKGERRLGGPAESVHQSLDGAEAVIVAIPGHAVADFARAHAAELDGKLVIDAANKFGDGPSHSAAEFAALANCSRYARAFNTLGWANFADPTFDGVVADLFYSADEPDRETVERLIRDVGLNPIDLGPGQHDLLDGVLKLLFTLVSAQGRGRHLALKVL
jgi:predicted dinucleotide-binding enzyme